MKYFTLIFIISFFIFGQTIGFDVQAAELQRFVYARR